MNLQSLTKTRTADDRDDEQIIYTDLTLWAEGVIIPHGIFDPVRNCGHVNIGLSRDRTEFACDSMNW